MDPADWLNINCDLIAASLDKSRIGYKSAGVPSSSGRRDGVKRDESSGTIESLSMKSHGRASSSIFRPIIRRRA